ncbi:MAG: FecR domain-containing protein [Spirosomataceae bacterium]
MSKQSFENLVEKYLAGTCTHQEKRLVEQWYELTGTEAEIPTEEQEWQIIKEKIWDSIQHQTETPRVLPLWRQPMVRWSIAAAVVLGLFSFLWFYSWNGTHKELVIIEKEGKVHVQNYAMQPRTLRLPDGSQVQLLANASLIYPHQFAAKTREITLHGDAFFQVTHNPAKPFLVNTGEIVTKVLGTSFWVRQKPNSEIEVDVRTGKVAVFEKVASNPKNNGVLLTPNQKVVYFAKEQHFVTGLVEKPEPIATTAEAKLVFDFVNQPLSEVIYSFEKTYGIRFETENPKLMNCTLTGDLTGLPMFTQLEVLCQSLGATYQVRGTSIVFSGKGCQ